MDFDKTNSVIAMDICFFEVVTSTSYLTKFYRTKQNSIALKSILTRLKQALIQDFWISALVFL